MSVTPDLADDLIVIGKIYSIHGVRGEVKVYSFTDPIDNLLDYKKLDASSARVMMYNRQSWSVAVRITASSWSQSSRVLMIVMKLVFCAEL